MAINDPMLDPEFKYSINTFPGDGATTVWNLNFAGGYLRREHVKAYTEDSLGNTTTRDLVFLSDNQVRVEPAVPLGVTLVVYRDTPKDKPLVDFTDGSIINERNLDLVAQQSVFVGAEMLDRFAATNEIAVEAQTVALSSVADAAEAKANAASSLSLATDANALATGVAADFGALLATVGDLVGEDLSNIPRLDVAQTWQGRQQFSELAVQSGAVGTEFTPAGTFRRNTGSGWGGYLTINAWSDLIGKPTAFPPEGHTHPWGQITGKPTAFPPEPHTHSYGSLSGIPATFTPSAHTHPWDQVTGKPNLAVNDQAASFSSLSVEGTRVPRIQVITGTPSGGSNGDVWFVVAS